ncbi:hypothetical protein DUI87_08738 [Hirundo rustica rustica]|uniref:Phosphatidate cytidylyltransferase n=1 Tax=Hirundo rustica rustica TaxID=333673 RepID=A0A3M0KM11_HIRRU|nr:hypothetical protein DUI87_08738 [Hirundo rustica rustica]
MSARRRRRAAAEEEEEEEEEEEAAGSDKDVDLEERLHELDLRSDSDIPDVPPPTDSTPEILKRALSGLSARWKNWWIRGILSLAMISGFFLIIYLGSFMLMLLVLSIQVKCYHEIITIGYRVYHSYDLPWFRSLSWYFLLCVNYFFYGETVADYFATFVQRREQLQFLIRYHRFISFALYLTGFCMFVLSLVKKHYRLQFYMFAWTHVTLLITVTQSHLVIQNLFEGMIWFLVPISSVICNDITAYIFGFFFGRTPLIKLSPKKTWEGFIGGFFSTVVFGFIFSYFLAQHQYFVCPVEYNSETNRFVTECEPSELFQMKKYSVPPLLQAVLGWETVNMYPFQMHSFALSTFASLIGPFGGFFASGFKRAFKIKDFADTIPGHGGIMDRFDCQYLMATFVHVYITSFISPSIPGLCHLSVKKFFLKLRKNSSRNASLSFLTCQEKIYLNLGQPLPTGLEELEAFSSTQKVLWWLESHVPSDPGSLAKEDEVWGNKVEKEQTQEILEENITRPESSERREDTSQKQESQATAKEDSGQEVVQGQEAEEPAARGEGSSKLQSTSPALAASMDTQEKAATSPSGAGACLLLSKAPGDRSPSLAAAHGPQQPQRQSLLRRALRAVRRAFLGTCRPRRRRQQCPAASARQVPGDGCSEPQQCP